MKWTTERMHEAELTFTERDSYRLHIPKTDEQDGIVLDVPGWVVGDIKQAERVLEAAKVIRKRLGVA